MDFNNIFKKNLDLLIDPWPLRDVEFNAKSALTDNLILPIGSVIDFSEGYDWNRDFGAGSNSIRLWLHSLPFIYDLCLTYKKTGAVEYADKAIQIFRLWHIYSKDENNNRITFSQEHAVANRSASIIFMIQTLNQGTYHISNEDIRDLVETILDHGWWLHSDDHYIWNNHGIMMDRALLQIAQHFSSEPYLYQEWKKKALERLNSMLHRSFGYDGLNVENSPGYHILNTNLFAKISDYVKHYKMDPAFLKDIQPVLEKARAAMPFMVRQDRKTPPIGDSEVVEYSYISPQNGSRWYSDNGYAVVKSDDVFFTLKCGCKGFVHKHVDETSITFRYCDQDIIVDAGVYNHDINDKNRRYFISYRAHSGLFTPEFDGLRFKDYVDIDLRKLAGIDNFSLGEDFVRLHCYNEFIPGLRIEREIIFLFPNVILLLDKATGINDREVYQQFLLHPMTKVTVNKDFGISAINGSVNFSLKQFILKDLKVRKIAGSYSEKFMIKEDCECIQYQSHGATVSFLTVIEAHIGKPGEIYDPLPELFNGKLRVRYEKREEFYALLYKERGVDFRNISSLTDDIQVLADGVTENPVLHVDIIKNAPGYIQLFDGAFESPANTFLEESRIPESSKKMSVKFVVDNLDPNNKVTVTVFLMQYDQKIRKSMESLMTVLLEDSELIHLAANVEPSCLSYKIAIKFSGFVGKVDLRDMKIGFE